MTNGVVLYYLLDELGNGKTPLICPDEKPTTHNARLKNIKAALEHMKSLHINTHGIVAKDIVDIKGKKTIEGILNILWEIIRKYHIQLGYQDNRTDYYLKRWVNNKIKH